MFKDLFNKKKSFAVNVFPSNNELNIAKDETLLAGALRSGLAWPHKCQVGSCGTCKCKIINGKTRAEIDFSYVLSPDELNDGYVLACQTSLKSDISVAVNLID